MESIERVDYPSSMHFVRKGNHQRVLFYAPRKMLYISRQSYFTSNLYCQNGSTKLQGGSFGCHVHGRLFMKSNQADFFSIPSASKLVINISTLGRLAMLTRTHPAREEKNAKTRSCNHGLEMFSSKQGLPWQQLIESSMDLRPSPMHNTAYVARGSVKPLPGP